MDFFEKAQARAHALEVLGLEGHPELDAIRAAYKKLAFEKHPDRCDGADEEFLIINEAYRLLNGDNGYTAADRLRPAPTDTGATTFTAKPRHTNPTGKAKCANRAGDAASSYVAPRRVRTAKTSRIIQIDQDQARECRTLLDELGSMAEPDPDESSLRASIMDAIKESGAPHVPHANHLPYAIRQSGRRISYMVNEAIAEGVNRVAVPTGVFTDNRKVLPIMVRFKSLKKGAGTHVVGATTLAESFPGAKSVRIHFGLGKWPEPAEETKASVG